MIQTALCTVLRTATHSVLKIVHQLTQVPMYECGHCMYSVQYTIACTAYSTLLHVQFTIHYCVYSVQYTIACTVYSTLLCVQCRVHYCMYSLQYTIFCTVYSTLLHVQFTAYYCM